MSQRKQGELSLRTRAIVGYGCIFVVLLVSLHFYNPALVGVAAVLLFVTVSVSLLARARLERRRAGRGPQP